MNTSVDWTNLPNLVLSLIADKTTYLPDYLRFGAVCLPWQSAYKENANNIPRQPPAFLILPLKSPHTVFNLSEKRFHKFNVSLPQDTVCRGSDYGWLVIVHKNRDIQLINPFLRLHTGIRIPQLQCRSQGICGHSTSYMCKAVLSANPLECPSFVVMTFRGFVVMRTLSLWKKGDEAWTNIHPNSIGSGIYNINNVIWYNDKCYVLSTQGVFVLDVNDPSSEALQINWDKGMTNISGCPDNYLVESGGELLQIVKWKKGQRVYHFEVFRHDQIKNTWFPVLHRGEHMLFVADNCSCLCLSTSNMLGCKPNCIYFIEKIGDNDEKVCFNFKVFNLEGGSITLLCTTGSSNMVTALEPIFILPKFNSNCYSL